jgi:hypothetical protein
MRTLLTAVVVVFLSFNANHAFTKGASTPVYETEIVEHGGGCRKNSPPGQCCHMNRKTGIVHCH